MKWVILVLSLIYVVPAAGEQLLILQSKAVDDIYGKSMAIDLLESSDREYASLLVTELVEYPSDSAHARYLKRYITRTLSEPYTVLSLGGLVPDVDVTEYNVLLNFDLTFLKGREVHVVSDKTHLAAIRLAKIKEQVEVKSVVYATNDTELSLVVRRLPRGKNISVVINTFNIVDQWGVRQNYYLLESIINRATTNMVVGVCGPNTRSDFSVGPTSDDITRIIDQTYVQRICTRMSSLNRWPSLVRNNKFRIE
jgi:hypothetical protein